MSKKTVLNENYKGVVESFSIPAEIHEVNGKKYASYGGTVPIHSCSPEQVLEYSNKTHHYCDIFTEQVLAPLAELAYVRLDENTAEKVFINRSKRLLLTSSDGRVAQWRSAATFESANRFVCGAPLVSARGELLSVLTARSGNHYAVSHFEGDGGYFDTPRPWTAIHPPPGALLYGDRSFESRDAVRAYVSSLPPAEVSPSLPPAPVLFAGGTARVALVAHNGRQISHAYIHGVISTDIEYL